MELFSLQDNLQTTRLSSAVYHVFFSTAFSPEQLVNAVQLTTQFAIWMGFLSLMVEILGALTR